MNLTLAACCGVLLVVLSAIDWRRAVKAALFLAVVEGALRKWAFPQASQLIYFAKDLVLVGAYIRYFCVDFRNTPGRLSENLKTLLMFAVGWAFWETFNSGTGSIAAGLFGWRAYVIYLPVCFLVSDLFRNADGLRRFLQVYCAFALPVALLGVAQFYAPTDSPLNVYAHSASAGEESRVAVFGEDEFVRVTGTFSYISGYSSYLVVIVALLLPVITWSRGKLWQGWLWLTLALAIGNATMTGSRATVLGVGIVLVGFALINWLTGSPAERAREWVTILALAAAVTATVYFFQKSMTAVHQRTEDSMEEGRGRLLGAMIEPFEFMRDAGLFGHGCGIAQPSVDALRSALNLPPPAYAFASPTDAENSRVLMELGVPGFLLWYSMRIGLVVALWKTRSRLKSPFLRQVALGAFLVLLFQLFTITMFAHTSNFYHWFLVGFIFLLPKLESTPSVDQISPRTKTHRVVRRLQVPRRQRPEPHAAAH